MRLGVSWSELSQGISKPCVSNENLLHSTGNSAQRSWEGNPKRKGYAHTYR